MKEKLINTFGVLYYIFTVISFILPVVMIKISFDLPFWTSFIMIAILFILPSLSSVLWIIGLIGVIMGPQDIIAIIYYVAFALVCLPTLFYTILGFFIKD